MTVDELIRAFCYFLMFPAYMYFALVAWNRRERLVAWIYMILSWFFLFLLIGLSTRHYYQPLVPLLHINTGIVVAMALAVGWRATALLLAVLAEWHVLKAAPRDDERQRIDFV